MAESRTPIVVAGHICVDIIPTFRAGPVGAGIGEILKPGRLIDVGPAVVATGGVVSNTGLALHRLGAAVRLMGKVGDDLLGHVLLEILRRHGPCLVEGMIVKETASTSYSVVISPPGTDRIFLHCPAANDTFCAADIDYDRLPKGGIFHFGYPPLMRRMYEGGGAELVEILRRVHARGLTTSLDMARPDPSADAGKADWPAILKAALPHVDLFCPSIDEMLYMLDRPAFERLERTPPDEVVLDSAMLRELAGRLLDMGTAVVGLKLGDQGLYLRTTADRERLGFFRGAFRGEGVPPLRPEGILPSVVSSSSSAASASPLNKKRVREKEGETRGRDAHGTQGQDALATWANRELLSPCFEVGVVGTTGAGDCTIAGFLDAIAKGASPQQAVTAATAVGACNCEAADSTSGVPHWSVVEARLRAGWKRRPLRVKLDGWRHDPATGLWHGRETA
jgi:sugar/nucleoside kinase (ribokinase family)